MQILGFSINATCSSIVDRRETERKSKLYCVLPTVSSGNAQIRPLFPVTYSTNMYQYIFCFNRQINRLMPNDAHMGRTAPLTSKRCILYIYSTNIGTEYFKYALHFPSFSLQNAVCFIMLTCLVPVLFIFYIQGVLKFKKKIIPVPKG